MRRTPEVIDTWFDSGRDALRAVALPLRARGRSSAPTSRPTSSARAIDQTRGWFYSLLAIATTVFDELPYRNVIVNEMILDAEGQKMSKSRGNIVDPWQVVREFGADTTRLYLLAASQVWLPKRFDTRAIPEVVGGFLNTLKQTYRFFALYAGELAAGRFPGGARARPRSLAAGAARRDRRPRDRGLGGLRRRPRGCARSWSWSTSSPTGTCVSRAPVSGRRTARPIRPPSRRCTRLW